GRGQGRMSATRPVLGARRLGRSALNVSGIGFGAAPIGDLYAHLNDATAMAALDHGVTLFDTSPLYGHGLSEHRCGTALRRAPRDAFVLSTKVGRVAEPCAPRQGGTGYVGGFPHALRFDYSYDGAMRSIEQSLLRLGLDRIDILLIHDVNRKNHGAG